jgi:hypothetical protein
VVSFVSRSVAFLTLCVVRYLFITVPINLQQYHQYLWSSIGWRVGRK